MFFRNWPQAKLRQAPHSYALISKEYTKFEDGADGVAGREEFAVDDNPADLTNREKLKTLLHSKIVHVTIIVLIILDTIFVLLELMIDVDVIRFDESNPLPDILHGFSIAILTIFMVEIMCKIYADHKHFLAHKIEVLDAVVVAVSFVVDIVLIFFEGSEVLVVLGLLVLLRLIRITNGIVVTAKAKADERVHLMKNKNKKLEESLKEAEEKIQKQLEELLLLKELLENHGINTVLTSQQLHSAAVGSTSA